MHHIQHSNIEIECQGVQSDGVDMGGILAKLGFRPQGLELGPNLKP